MIWFSIFIGRIFCSEWKPSSTEGRWEVNVLLINYSSSWISMKNYTYIWGSHFRMAQLPSMLERPKTESLSKLWFSNTVVCNVLALIKSYICIHCCLIFFYLHGSSGQLSPSLVKAACFGFKTAPVTLLSAEMPGLAFLANYRCVFLMWSNILFLNYLDMH